MNSAEILDYIKRQRDEENRSFSSGELSKSAKQYTRGMIAAYNKILRYCENEEWEAIFKSLGERIKFWPEEMGPPKTGLDVLPVHEKLSKEEFLASHHLMSPDQYNRVYGHYFDPSDFGYDSLTGLRMNVVIHVYTHGLHIIEYRLDRTNNYRFELPFLNDCYEAEYLSTLEHKLYNGYLEL